jgi:recombination protein RecA
MENNAIKQMREAKLTEDQISVLVGSLLGDGYLDQTTMGYSLRLHHGVKQKDYIEWKYNYLKNLVNTPPKIYGTRIYCRTVSHPFLKHLRKLFYGKNCKIIPKNFLGKSINPLALAVWIMDDGTNELGSGKCLKINSQSFSYDEHKYLCSLLRRKFGLKANINKDRTYFRIRFHKESMAKLIEIVKPYILPSLFYKLSP